jgi:hypothetical protein
VSRGLSSDELDEARALLIPRFLGDRRFVEHLEEQAIGRVLAIASSKREPKLLEEPKSLFRIVPVEVPELAARVNVEAYAKAQREKCSDRGVQLATVP